MAGGHTHDRGGEKRGAEHTGRDQTHLARHVLRTWPEGLGLRSKPRYRYAAESIET